MVGKRSEGSLWALTATLLEPMRSAASETKNALLAGPSENSLKLGGGSDVPDDLMGQVKKILISCFPTQSTNSS